jgi:hypothetical protein
MHVESREYNSVEVEAGEAAQERYSLHSNKANAS